MWTSHAQYVCADARVPHMFGMHRKKAFWARINACRTHEEHMCHHMRIAHVISTCPGLCPSVTCNTLGRLYAPGYNDVQLQYRLGNDTCYGAYLSNVGMLLSCPHAVAFVAMGGILSFIAQTYDEDIVFRYLRGPSLQVSEFQEGDKISHQVDSHGFFLITDRVSPREISLLLGHIATGDPRTETSLWPHPNMFLSESVHNHGVWTPSCYKILKNLKEEIMGENANPKWRNRKQWAQYFKAGNQGKYAPLPDTIPSKEEFKSAQTLVQSAFPVDWNKKRILDIVVPEVFEPNVHRE
ncbi:hypothetical protein FB451DRAFT_1368362 [Mycena latifolia]|nr:hypothetical protein FB451DRAFT_1368362 [Mycena latifolia]